jgi:predicted outer membrane repeat protein
VISESRISHNSSKGQGGGLHCEGSSPILTSCLVFRNTSAAGGALSCENDCRLELIQSTLYGNSSSNGGAIQCRSQSSLSIERSIISFTAGDQAATCDTTSSVIAGCSDVYGNAGGDWVGCLAGQDKGNLSADPQFCDPDRNDFRISEDSPCAADNNPTCGSIGFSPAGCDP